MQPDFRWNSTSSRAVARPVWVGSALSRSVSVETRPHSLLCTVGHNFISGRACRAPREPWDQGPLLLYSLTKVRPTCSWSGQRLTLAFSSAACLQDIRPYTLTSLSKLAQSLFRVMIIFDSDLFRSLDVQHTECPSTQRIRSKTVPSRSWRFLLSINIEFLFTKRPYSCACDMEVVEFAQAHTLSATLERRREKYRLRSPTNLRIMGIRRGVFCPRWLMVTSQPGAHYL